MRTTDVGAELFVREVEITRELLVRYAGASGDVNAIHYNDAVAEAAGLPGVIAHGMLTMGLAGSALTDWLAGLDDDGVARVVRYGVRFSRPIVVPALGSTTLVVTGTLGARDDEAGTARVDLRAVCDGVTVLGKAQATITL
nr:MaoC/PaaZ C-terminal domain-containing protein [Beutenbergia cavernae]